MVNNSTGINNQNNHRLTSNLWR